MFLSLNKNLKLKNEKSEVRKGNNQEKQEKKEEKKEQKNKKLTKPLQTKDCVRFRLNQR